MRKPILVVMTAILVLAAATLAMSGDPRVGTWKLNVAKSKFNSGPADKSSIVTATAQDNGIKIVDDIVKADGKAVHIEFTAKYDGMDYPITGDPTIDTIATTRIDANTWTEVFKKAGKKVQISGRVVISKDGKTSTHTTKGKDAKGQDYMDILVHDKR